MSDDSDFNRLAAFLGTAISTRRRELGWTQEDLSGRCDVTPGYVARIERGERLPSPILLDRIGRALGLRVAEMWPAFGGDAAMEARAPYPANSRDAAVARLTKVVEGLSASEIRELAAMVQRLLRAGRRMGKQ